MRLFLILFLFIKPLWANYYLVSDFDDTIKAYHSHSAVPYVFNALFKKRMYAGFNLLYQEMVEQSGEDQFTVLTASPRILDKTILSFLEKFDFPVVNLVTRKLGQDSFEYKKETIQKEYQRVGRPLILIGDDHHADAEVYQSINKDKVLEIYIRRVENKKTLPGQIRYFSAFDIADNEYQRGRLSIQSVLAVGDAVLDGEDEEIIPPYAYCPTNLSGVGPNDSLAEMRTLIANRINDICQQRSR